MEINNDYLISENTYSLHVDEFLIPKVIQIIIYILYAYSVRKITG